MEITIKYLQNQLCLYTLTITKWSQNKKTISFTAASRRIKTEINLNKEVKAIQLNLSNPDERSERRQL